MSVNLPPVLGDYFAAANAHDPERVAVCFAEDATVHDEGRDIAGRDAIRAWAEETSRKYRVTADIRSIEDGADGPIVTARVAGTFPGSPIDLGYRFRLSGDRIAELAIG